MKKKCIKKALHIAMKGLVGVADYSYPQGMRHSPREPTLCFGFEPTVLILPDIFIHFEA